MFIKKAEESDIKNIVELHKYSYDEDHFTSTFSKKQLFRYYSTIMRFNNFNVVAYDDSENLLGFIIAGDRIKYAIGEFIRRNYIILFLYLIKNPRFLFQKIIYYLNLFTHKSHFPQIKFRLLSIAVNRRLQDKGIGSQLISHFENELKCNGINVYGLSVRKSNEGAIMFYNKNNFKIEFEDKNTIYYYKNL